jgi:pimeloyl-ACP methyl ester carboxylesterase
VVTAFGLARHVPPIVLGDASAIDVAGAAVCLAGLALVAVAFRTALRGRRLRWKLAAIPVILLLLQFYVFPVVLAGLAVNADRFDVAFDARGHGESGGDPNALGWLGDDDVEGAVEFLRTRRRVDPTRVGVLGLSMGGEEALRAAAGDGGIAAIVADGAGASTTGDVRATGASGLERVVNWLGMRATEALSGDREPDPLTNRVTRISAPVLLIASNASGELAINREFARRLRGPTRLWHVDADHTVGLARHPRAYRARVGAFLATQL